MMKFLFPAAFLLLCSAVRAQSSFHLGAVVLDFNSGLEVYKSTNVYTLVEPGGSSDTTINDRAGNSNFSLGLEVGIGRFVGLGLRGKANTYFRSLDAVTNARADINSTDLVAVINLHPLPLKRFDLVLGAEAGLSRLRMDVNDLAQTFVTGKGGFFSIYLNPRFYLKRFGFNVRAALPVFNYQNLQHSTKDPAGFIISQWKASGLGISLGAQFRFF